MILRDEIDLAITKRKLLELEELFEETRSDPEEEEQIREVTLESLAKLIKQLKEEIVLYEIHHQAGADVPREEKAYEKSKR